MVMQIEYVSDNEKPVVRGQVSKKVSNKATTQIFNPYTAKCNSRNFGENADQDQTVLNVQSYHGSNLSD